MTGERQSCPRCGHTNRREAHFCGACGLRMAMSPEPRLEAGPLPQGELLAGRYRIERQLGGGGFGEAYLAEDTAMGRLCVVKRLMLRPEWDAATRRAIEAAFSREARLLVELNHPGHPCIPEIFAFLPAERCLVMKYITGASLRRASLRAGGRLPTPVALRYAREVCSALVYMHAQQPEPVIHRDLKPDNIMLDSTGRVWLIDFGLARGAPQPGPVGAEASQAAGTPGYAPPEQWVGAAEPRSDIYALAATLYHLLTGERPPLLPRDLAPLRQRLSDADPALEALIAAAMAPEPATRPQARELLEALDGMLGEAPVAPPPAAEIAPVAGALVGRDAELRDLDAQLERTGALALVGMPGVGKTALAATLARQIAAPGRVLWHTCRPGDGPDQLVWRLAALLYHGGEQSFWRLLQRRGAVPPPGVLLDAMLSPLRAGGYLLCFDDLHQLDASGAVALVEQLLRAAGTGGPRLLATVRRAPPWLPAAVQRTLGGLSPAAATEFVALRELAGGEALAERLHRATEGNPQLLTLAVEALRRAEAPERSLSRLAEVADLEQYLLNEVDRGLSDEQRAVMEGLAALLGFAAPQAAIEATLDGESARRALAELRARSLVMLVPGDEPRYQQHAMVRDFYYRLLGRKRRAELHRAAAGYYEHEGGDRLAAARHRTRAGEPARAAALLADDPVDLIGQGRAHELATELAAIPQNELSPVARAALAAVSGEVAALLGDYRAARAALASEKEAGPDTPPELAARRLRLLAMVDERTGHYDDAEAHCLSGLALLTDADAPLETARLTAQLAEIRLRRGDLAGAEAACADGLQALEPWPRAARERIALLRWQAEAAAARGEYQRAIAGQEASLELAHAAGDVRLLAAIRNNLGRLCFITGQLDAALAHTEAAAQLLTRIGDVVGQASTLGGLGMIHMATGETVAAAEAFQASRDLAERYGVTDLQAMALSNLAQLALEQGRPAEAAPLIAEADTIFGRLDIPAEQARCRALRGEIALALGDAPAAAAFAREALDLARTVESRPVAGMALRVIGLAHLADGDHRAAATALGEAWQLHEALGDPYDQALTLTALARLDIAGGALDQALARARQALDLARDQQIGFLIAELEALLGLE